MRYAEQAKCELARQRPEHRRPPHLGCDALVVDYPLLVERACPKQRAYMTSESRTHGEVALERARHEARQAVKVEAAAFAGKPVEPPVPVSAGEIRKLVAQTAGVQVAELRVKAVAEDAEE